MGENSDFENRGMPVEVKNGSKESRPTIGMKRSMENKTKKPALSRKDNRQLLDTFELTDSSSKNLLISNVKKLYSDGIIVRLDAAESLIRLIQEGKMDEFDKKFSAIEAKEQTKVAKKIETELKTEEIFKLIERGTKNFNIRIKHKKSELPTFEVEFKNEYADFDAAWKAGVTRLISLAEKQIAEKRNIKISVGVTATVIKQKDGEDLEEQTVHAHTTPEAVYAEEAINKS